MRKKREFGRTGIKVNPIGLGAMPLSVQGRPDERQAIAVLQAALDAGTEFIDTANAYCLDQNDIGHNERLIAKALREWRGDASILVSTKGGVTRPDGRWEMDGRPEALRLFCEQSLTALGVEAITLYQLHSPDPNIPFTDSIGELALLQKEGKIVHLGLSNVTLDQLNQAQQIVRVESVQNKCNSFFKADLKNGLIDACKEQGMTYIAYWPVGGHHDHTRAATFDPFVKLAEYYDTNPYRVMLAWLLHQGDHIIPIPGARRIESAQDSPKAAQLILEPDHLEYINGFPDI